MEDVRCRSLDEILNLAVQIPDDERVTLSNGVLIQLSTDPVTINRKGRQRLIAVSAHVMDRDLGTVAADIQVQLEHMPCPADHELPHFRGL